MIAAAAVDEVADGVRAVRRRRLRGRDGGAKKRTINTLIPALKDAGATDILELPLSKIVH